MRILAGLLLVGVFLMPLVVYGQQTTISGRVVDSETLKPVPFTHIFIVNTSLGTTTDEEGNFHFVSENFGEADIVVSFVGYDTYRKHIIYSGETINLGTIRLKPSETELNEVVVKSTRDEAWEKDLKKFKGIFMGKDAFASECTIENPWVIDLQNDQATKTLTAKSLAPIKITNKALGYELTFSLKRMVSTTDGYSIEGDSYFTAMKAPTPKENERWIRNRESVYRHSVTNLLRSMIHNTINGEGFALYSEQPGQGDSFTRLGRFGDNFAKKIQPADTFILVKKQMGTDKFVVSFKGRLEAHYRNEKSRNRVYMDISHSVSWLTLSSSSIIVNAQGIPTIPTAITVSGGMSDDRVASMLPLDYIPKGDNRQAELHAIEELQNAYEQIYVHTDKSYYYAGEQLWFKGYINYQSPEYRDSSSCTVYVDFITPEKKILLSKTLRIDSGRFSGSMNLPIGSDAGTYNLRAYTNLQRNFGDSTLYVKPVPVLDLKDFVERQQVQPVDQRGVAVTTVKGKYKSREKIEIQIKLTDEKGNPVGGDLSMSVTDAKQVSPVNISQNVLERYPIQGVPRLKSTIVKKPFAVEYGITINGRFLNAAGKPEKAEVNVVQINPKGFAMVESDAKGNFKVNDLTIYDSARFSITASDKKGKTYGKAVLTENDKPAVIYKGLKDSLRITPASTVQRDLSGYKKPGEATMLDAVEIRGKRIRDEYSSDFRVRRPYGKANYVLTSKDFFGEVYPNVMMMIQGRFPGLIVRQAVNDGELPRWVVYLNRNERGSVNNVKEVAVTVNDNFMAGSVEQILSAISPSTIEAIELKTSVNVLYGMASNAGILAIYLKDGASLTFDAAKTIGTVKALGYSFSPAFSGPDYETENPGTPDFRSLIYWNPIVLISNDGTATISFYSADLETTYKIEVEGVNSEGKPVRAVKTIEIGN